MVPLPLLLPPKTQTEQGSSWSWFGAELVGNVRVGVVRRHCGRMTRATFSRLLRIWQPVVYSFSGIPSLWAILFLLINLDEGRDWGITSDCPFVEFCLPFYSLALSLSAVILSLP